MPVHRREVHEKIRAGGGPSPLTFTGRAGGDNPIGDELRAADAGICVRDLVLDFTNVRRVNNLELGTLVELHKRLAAAAGPAGVLRVARWRCNGDAPRQAR